MKKNCLIPILILLTAFISGCKNERKLAGIHYKLNQKLMRWAVYDEGYPVTEEEVDSLAPYQTKDYLDYYLDYYKGKKQPFPFQYDMDLSGKTFNELRMLRAEILARHGFLFMDYTLRAHFNATDWYQPVFWDNDFKIKLNQQEKRFISRVLVREKELYRHNYIESNGVVRANLQNVVNWEQVDKIPAIMRNHLNRDGFVINKSGYEQLFYVYDENYYDYMPSFITTDLFLQVMHMHISKEMQELEEERIYPLLQSLLAEQLAATRKMALTVGNDRIKNAAQWGQTYYAVALSLLTGKKQVVPTSNQTAYDYEMECATSASGQLSALLGDSLMDYTQFEPRANYTRTDTLKRYFRCMKWLNSASVYIDKNDGLARAIVMGSALLHNPDSYRKYKALSGTIEFLAGEENNLSFSHLMRILQNAGNTNTNELLTDEKLADIRQSLLVVDPRKFAPKPANEYTEKFLTRKRLYFTAGRYTFDNEIMQRLVHTTKPQPKRKFPKALDVFAAMGNKQAEDILLNGYKEQATWPQYADTLKWLQNKFRYFGGWNDNVYNKTMNAALALNQKDPMAPCFMQTKCWEKKNLNTMLAAWTGLRHDMLLYVEQPSGAEMGDGGDIPPPQKIAYVEPQVEFWVKCIELLQLNAKTLSSHGLLTTKLASRNKSLISIADFLKKMSEKELHGKHLTNTEFDRLAQMGGEVESLTLNIINSNEMDMSTVTTPDKCMAIAADVYTYKDSIKGGQTLEECVGLGDEIYVIAQINGLLYLTRGAVFSHHEFQQPISSRLTDEAWQEILAKKQEPKPAYWLNDIKISMPKLKTAPNYNLY
ncbi:MAG TPA: DUF3160 domain-containing protein [Paludibacter sp.]|nr:DUF3160 domain-containing protein [Paludibacter sp.]